MHAPSSLRTPSSSPVAPGHSPGFGSITSTEVRLVPSEPPVIRTTEIINNKINIPYGQLSAKLQVVISPGHQEVSWRSIDQEVIRSSGH